MACCSRDKGFRGGDWRDGLIGRAGGEESGFLGWRCGDWGEGDGMGVARS